MIASLWNLTGTSTAVLPRCLSNFRVIGQLYIQIPRLRDFTRSYNKTSYRILKRGPGLHELTVGKLYTQRLMSGPQYLIIFLLYSLYKAITASQLQRIHIMFCLCCKCVLLSCGSVMCSFHDSKVHGANMGPTWVLSSPGGPHVGPMNLAIWVPISLVSLRADSLAIALIPKRQPWRIWLNAIREHTALGITQTKANANKPHAHSNCPKTVHSCIYIHVFIYIYTTYRMSAYMDNIIYMIYIYGYITRRNIIKARI